MAKYEMVQKHDRAGRLVDAQEFRRFELPRDRFTPAVLDELLGECANSCRLIGDDVLIEHLYVERRLRPLNLYLREVPADEARAAIVDYGQAIRDLAITNIFPGDLLLKNFGVSRLGRVIFYDYASSATSLTATSATCPARQTTTTRCAHPTGSTSVRTTSFPNSSSPSSGSRRSCCPPSCPSTQSFCTRTTGAG